MKKAMKVTMKRVQTVFVRRKSKDTRDGNPVPDSFQDECGNIPIENGLEASEVQDSTEPSPEPLDILLSSEEKGNRYFKYPNEDNQQHRTRVEVAQNNISETADTKSSDDQGACGPIVPGIRIQDVSQLALVPVNGGGQIVAENVYPRDVLRSCGDLEKKCSNFPLELQEKIFRIKENLLWHYPPYYDFCVISSDNDYEEAIQFKDYVATSFGLAGCTLDDGFRNLGSELFDNYESMMDHSSKVFFFVTENFTSSAFCKRLQSGAVFMSLMSKAKKDREKCVPVFPHGFQEGCKIPLALLGIAGLNPTQKEITRRSLVNTYSPQLRQRRYVLDLENFKRRCLEFQIHVTKCIEEYRTNSIQHELSVMSLAENYQLSHQRNCPILEAPQPVIQLAENDDTDKQNLSIEIHSIKSSDIKAPTVEKENEKLKEEKISREIPPSSQKQKFNKKSENSRMGCKDHSFTDNNEVGYDDKDDIWNNLPDEIREMVPDEVRESVNNTVSTVNITDSATVHVGHVINVTINQASPSVFSHLEQNIKNCTSAFCEKDVSQKFSDSSD